MCSLRLGQVVLDVLDELLTQRLRNGCRRWLDMLRLCACGRRGWCGCRGAVFRRSWCATAAAAVAAAARVRRERMPALRAGGEPAVSSEMRHRKPWRSLIGVAKLGKGCFTVGFARAVLVPSNLCSSGSASGKKLETAAGQQWRNSTIFPALAHYKCLQIVLFAKGGKRPEGIDKLGVTGSSPVPPISEGPPCGPFHCRHAKRWIRSLWSFWSPWGCEELVLGV
jgi:hypothetical protein